MAALHNVQYLRAENENLRRSLLEVQQERDDMQREACGIRSENEQFRLQRRDLERELAEAKRMIEHLAQACRCHETEFKPAPSSTPARKRKRPHRQVSEESEIDVDNFPTPRSTPVQLKREVKRLSPVPSLAPAWLHEVIDLVSSEEEEQLPHVGARAVKSLISRGKSEGSNMDIDVVMKFPDEEDGKPDSKAGVKVESKAKKEELRFSVVPKLDSYDEHSPDVTFLEGLTDDLPFVCEPRVFPPESEQNAQERVERSASISRERTAQVSRVASTSELTGPSAHFLEGDLSELSDLTSSDSEEEASSEEDAPGSSSSLKVKTLRDFSKESSTIGSVRARYLTLPAFIIHPAPKRVYFPRAFISNAFGGSSQSFLQTLRSGIKCAFPKQILNPAVAASPGQPGLMFTSRVEIRNNLQWYVFSQNESESGRVVWEYVGGYEFKVVGELKGSTFKGLPEDVKRAWGKLLASSKSRKQDVYVSLRARVALRKYGMVVDSQAEQLEMAEIRAGRGYALEAEDIVEALSSGEEGIKILGMKCTSYDHAFVEKLIAKRRNWTPKLRKQRTEKKGRKLEPESGDTAIPKTEDISSSSRERRRTRRRLDLSFGFGEYEEKIDDDPSYEAGESSGGED